LNTNARLEFHRVRFDFFEVSSDRSNLMAFY